MISAETLFSQRLVYDAIVTGSLEMLQWICEVCGGDTSIVSLRGAAMHGHLHIVKWLCEQSSSMTLAAWEVAEVADAGHMQILEYLHST